MELKDLLITPLWLTIIFIGAFLFRSRFTDATTRPYFLPALTLKILGALCVGIIYQFYYDGGDTFNFFTHGSHHIWEAFKESPLKALKLVLAQGEHYPDTFKYSSQIWYYRDMPSYFVVRVVAILDLFTLHTYSATASLFAVISFTGLWALFMIFCRFYPSLHKEFALAILFVPSVVFWGSGIMKDTLTLAGVAWITYGFCRIFIFKEYSLLVVLIMLLSFYVIYSIRVYILLCLIPSLIIWYFLNSLHSVKSDLLRLLIRPAAILIAVLFSYLAIDQVSKNNSRYAIDRLSQTAKITAKWISYVSDIEGGSGYTLGDFDYTPTGMIRKLPQAVNVTLFRPYFWEVKNPVMLMAAAESLLFLLVTVYTLLKVRFGLIKSSLNNPLVLFCLLFAISFAFAVGFSTYNFGSLVRYKIPLMPFYLVALAVIHYENRARKLAR